MHIPFRSLDIFRHADVNEQVPPRYRWLATALRLTDADGPHIPRTLRGYWTDGQRQAEDLYYEGARDAFIQDVGHFVSAAVMAVDGYLSGHLDRREEEVAPADDSHRRRRLRALETPVFEGLQAVLHRAVARRVTAALNAQHAVQGEDLDAAREAVRQIGHRPIVCSGRPGTGKSTVLHANIREALAGGASVLVALPTARLATRMSEKLGRHEALMVDTFTAAFQLHKPEQETLFVMCGYDLVVVDEFSQLSQEDFERLLRLWHGADQIPALVFLGDKYQLPGVAPTRPWQSSAWNSREVQFLHLHHVFRCTDPDFLETLQLLRTSMPTKLQLNKICRGHKAWVGQEPSAQDVGNLLRTHPAAMFLAATRQGVATINRLALEALHPRAQPLVVLPGAFEDNADNYVAGKLRGDRRPVPADVPIYKGICLYLTRNVRKQDDYIDGMQCRVLSYNAQAHVLWVKTATGKRLPITPWSDPEHPGLRFFPIRLGYCATVHKAQGDEFPFVIIYLDTANMPAVGYTALSRVKDSRSYLLGGRLSPEHFAPATMR